MDRIDLLLLMHEARARPFGGHALVLGADDGKGVGEIDSLARVTGVKLAPDGSVWHRVGFERAVRAGEIERDRALSLEDADIPADLAGAYDIVLDLGHAPRRFHMPHVMANLCRMAKVGGRIIHVAPSCNHVDRAYTMMSPTYYADFYAANGFAIDALCVIRCPVAGPVDVLGYEAGRLAPISHGGLDGAPYRVLCVARKTAASRTDAVPQQGSYLAAWQGAPSSGEGPSATRTSPLRALWHRLRHVRPVYRVVHAVLTPAKRRRLMAACLPRVARYELPAD